VRAARAAIREHRSQIVLATGGFVSAPVSFAARAERVPFVLLNLDAVAGKANRFCARSAALRLTAVTGPQVPGRWEAVRPVVRSSALPSGTPAECRARLGLDPHKPTLLVTGGSQGARSINQMMARLTKDASSAFKPWQILHQCGSGDSEEQRAAYRRAWVDAICVDYLDDMASAWGAADLAVARCGAGTVSEIWAARVPSVLLPYPYHRDNHQALNAERLSNADAAIIHTDRIDAQANTAEAGATILELMQDDPARHRMRSAFDRLGHRGSRITTRTSNLAAHRWKPRETRQSGGTLSAIWPVCRANTECRDRARPRRCCAALCSDPPAIRPRPTCSAHSRPAAP